MSNASGPAQNVHAPGKVNLHLRVGPRRDDGFHPLVSWVSTIGFFDSLILRSVDSVADQLVVISDDVSVPTDARNLALRAVQEFRRSLAVDSAAGSLGKAADPASAGGSVSIRLEKRIPAGAGLGGGSSDAAAVLLGLNRLWNTGLALDRLAAMAIGLGSDVPFFLYGSSCVCGGRGEVVRPVGVLTRAWVTLVLPPIGLPTADVYRRFDEMGLGNSHDIAHEPDWDAWTRLDSRSLLPLLVNDLERPAFSLRPELSALHVAIENMLDRPVRMSGSGSSLFTLFDDPSQAADAAGGISEQFQVRSISVKLGPSERQ